MIISENQVAVPGRKFKTKVTCVSTRRLTAIEWLLLNCAKKFSFAGQPTYGVKEVFEKVFQFQNSELLIKPCLRSLADLRVIEINEGNAYDYATLRFSEIKLTELGQIMLKDGLLPGERRDIPIEVYYNPLTGKITTTDWKTAQENAFEFGVESDYDLEFPKQKIIDGLQSGAVASGKFTAAKFRIEDIENLVGSDWTFITDIAIDLDEQGEIRTIPDILEESVYGKVNELLKCKELTAKILEKLPGIDEIEVNNIKGSGSNIKQTVQEICTNSKVILIHNTVYDAFKRNTSFFRNKIVVVFGGEKSFEIEVSKEKKDSKRFIYISEEFPIGGVILMNEKGESLSLCKAEWDFKGIKINAPVAADDMRMLPKNRMIEKWIESIVLKNINEDAIYASLICLPGLITNKKGIFKELAGKWNDSDIETIVLDVKNAKNVCDQLGVLPLELSSLTEIWEKKIDYKKPEKALEQLGELVSAGLISKRSDVYGEITRSILEKLKKPKNYSDLIGISQKLGIASYEDTLAMPEIEESIYTKDVIADILTAIVRGDSIRVPLWFNWDIFFADYLNNIRCVEAHIDGHSLFESLTASEAKKAVDMCPNIGSLQMYFSELISQNAYLMEQGINVFSVMKKEDPEKTKAYSGNLKSIESNLKKAIEAEYTSAKTGDIKKGKSSKQKVFVLDTCALIHNPRLLLFFSDDEYVRIPTKVIDEIGKIKDRRSDKYSADASSTARMLARSIKEEYLGLFNANNKIRLLIENADTSLLPEDFDPSVPDNQILSVALKYNDSDTTIISDDTVFQLASISQDVKTMNSEEFIESHRENYKSLDVWKQLVKSRPPVILPKIANSKQEKEIVSEQKETTIDELPIRELMKYAPELTNPIMSFLNTNGIRTIGQFKGLTSDKVDAFKAKGAQSVYKNTLRYAITRMDQIIEKMDSDLKTSSEG